MKKDDTKVKNAIGHALEITSTGACLAHIIREAFLETAAEMKNDEELAYFVRTRREWYGGACLMLSTILDDLWDELSDLDLAVAYAGETAKKG